MSSMVGAKDVVNIYGGIFNQNNHPDRSDLQKFHEHIAKDVFHNSQKRSEEANPRNVNDITHQWIERLRRMPIPSDSRDSLFDALVVEDVIKDIFIWLHDPSTHCLAMWVYDDDRSLTSLIGQAVAEILAKRRELSATYFFPREQGVTDPGTDTTYLSLVVPTIAYQLMRSIPEVEDCISETLAHHVSIFDLRVQDQVTKLVIEPLKHASESLEQLPQRASANVIVVHTLEDSDNADFQMIVLEEFLRGLASIEAIPYSQRLLLLGRSTDHLRECFLTLPVERILQRPVHIQPWRTRVQDIHRREEKLMKDEEDLCRKVDHVKQEQEAAQKAWKLRLQAKKAEEEVRQREERLRQQEDEFRRRQELFLQREVAIDEKEKNSSRVEKDLEKRIGEVEEKVKEMLKQQEMLQMREEELLHKDQAMSVAWEAEVKEIQRMEDELYKREETVKSQIEQLKKRQDEALERERQIEPKALEVKEKKFRILVIGNVRVLNRAGKTSLVRSILKIDPKDAHDDAASLTNIEHEYTSRENILFILHDIPGFQVENGRQNENTDALKTVERFLRARSKRRPQDNVHGIWFCIDLHPQFRWFGPKYTIDKEKLFSLAKELNIPVLTVFTRFDLLVNEQRRHRGDLSESDLEKHAENWLHGDIKQRKLVPPESAPFVKVSTSENYPRRLERLQELTDVTLKYLDKHHGLDKLQ